MGRRLPSGLLFGQVIAASACVRIGATAVLPTATRSAALLLRRIDEAMTRTAGALTFSITRRFLTR